MIGHLYRYPHPIEKGKFLYVGQGTFRDKAHRSGATSFGRRFKKCFPNSELPQPVREVVEVDSQLELNELETVWMFRFHTWQGYSGGMNLVFPGSQDYKEIRKLVPIESLSRAGRKSGNKNVENGHLEKVRPKNLGLINVQTGHIYKLSKLSADWSKSHPTEAKLNASKAGMRLRDLRRGVHGFSSEQHVENGKKAGALAVNSGQVQNQGLKNAESGLLKRCSHIRWHVNRGLISPFCAFCSS